MGDATGDPSEAAIEAAVGNRGIGMGDASLRRGEWGVNKVEERRYFAE